MVSGFGQLLLYHLAVQVSLFGQIGSGFAP